MKYPTKSENTIHRISEEKSDKAYFTQTPRLIWALSRDPYDYILWNVVKDVAGEEGECYLSTRTLAKMGMMSVGKVVDCRDYLISAGLLMWEMKTPRGCTQEVMHLKIVDIWQQSIEWSKEHKSISDRLQFKEELIAKIKDR